MTKTIGWTRHLLDLLKRREGVLANPGKVFKIRRSFFNFSTQIVFLRVLSRLIELFKIT